MARIVVADDDPDILSIVSMSLEAMGHQVMRATNGREAVDAVRAMGPDLVVMDLMMPEVDGYQATMTLKSDPLTSGIPVLALTAKAMRGDEEKGRQAGVDAYITKPFRISQVIEIINQFVTA
jgi:twitching motility two-component system response regulator PilH